MKPSRERIASSLPVMAGDLSVRAWRREDIDRFAEWPLYPPHSESFNEVFQLRFARMSADERDAFFEERERRLDRVTLVADHRPQPAIAYLALVEIDWAGGTVGNMAYRVEPTWCGRGIGTCVLGAVRQHLFRHGFRSVRLDVAASNARAVRCYEKAGFEITGEFWRDDPGLAKIDLALPEWDFLRPHVRLDGPVPRLRFRWMEARVEG